MMQRTITRGARALFRMLVFTACGVSACLPALHAQPPDTITANPKAVALRQVWVAYGQHSNDRVGSGIGGIPDINGDSINEFAVYDGSAGFKIYYGSKEPLTTTPAMVLKVGGTHPIVGDFWGTGHNAVGGLRGASEVVNGQTIYHTFVYLYRTDGGSIDTSVPTILDPRKMKPTTRISPDDVVGADLDGDGDDELIIYQGGVIRDSVVSRYPEVWIYRGGPDFQVDTPTVILRDPESNGGRAQQALFVGRWDGDGYMDIATSSDYSDGTNKTKFWFSSPGSPWNWAEPQHTILFGALGVTALDADGDSILDFAAPPRASTPWRSSLYLSGSEKSIHTRSLDKDDADMTFYRVGVASVMNFGYLSDSLRRYEMLGVGNMGFNGGPDGPDHQYDVADLSGEAYNLHYPIADVTGDGWNDFIVGYGARNFNAGYAAIFAGGPYIPRDSLTTGVVDVVVAGRRDAVSIWPLPARDELHIAWRGDLSHLPARFTVHDVLGRLVAEGDVEPWHGEAVWNCGNHPPGTYFVSIFDTRRALLVTTSIIKQ